MSRFLKRDSVPLGDKVILEIVESRKQERGGIIIPQHVEEENNKLVKGKVISLGEEAKKEGIDVGSVVLFDKHSVFSDRTTGYETVGQLVITKVENIIVIVESE
jgi:co-chaperonin GroES (HSP10)